MLFYKATTAGNKGGIVSTQRDGPIDGRQGLRAKLEQIIHVDSNTFAGSLSTVADIVVRDQGSEIDQRADIERSRQGDEVALINQPFERFKAMRVTMSSSPNATRSIQIKAAMRHQVSR